MSSRFSISRLELICDTSGIAGSIFSISLSKINAGSHEKEYVLNHVNQCCWRYDTCFKLFKYAIGSKNNWIVTQRSLKLCNASRTAMQFKSSAVKEHSAFVNLLLQKGPSSLYAIICPLNISTRNISISIQVNYCRPDKSCMLVRFALFV